MGIKEILWQLKNQAEDNNEVFQSLRKKHSPLSQFPSFPQLRQFLHQKENTDYARKDAIILALLSEHKANPDKTAIVPFVIVLFAPAVTSIFYRYAKRLSWHPQLSSSDLAMLIISLFLEQIAEAAPTEKVFSRITGTLKNKLRKYFRLLYLEAKAEKEYQLETAEEDLLTIDSNTFLKALNEFAREEYLSEIQKKIIVSSLLLGQSLKEVAKSLNLSPENVRQKKHRGLKIVRDFLCLKNK